MPELPDLLLYLHALVPRVVGRRLEDVKLYAPFLLRTVDPPLSATIGRRVVGLRRVGKRVVFALEGDLFLVVHLMIAGRFQWKPRTATMAGGGAGAASGAASGAARAADRRSARPAGKIGLAAFEFENGTLLLTEAGTKKRASLHVVRGEAGLRELDPGGAEPLEMELPAFRAALLRENHTLKRVLTDPHVFAGIGNAYSDEILHRARLSPFKWTTKLTDEEIARLFDATKETLAEWIVRLQQQAGSMFPAKVTAFRPGMAVHGRYGKPCPVCRAPVQRIVHAENESNYCARCQTEGKVLADRALSQLLKDDWPRTLEEWEAIQKPRE